MISSVCEICGCADEMVTFYGGRHQDCYRRTDGRWYERFYQRTVDLWWWSMNKLFG